MNCTMGLNNFVYSLNYSLHYSLVLKMNWSNFSRIYYLMIRLNENCHWSFCYCYCHWSFYYCYCHWSFCYCYCHCASCHFYCLNQSLCSILEMNGIHENGRHSERCHYRLHHASLPLDIGNLKRILSNCHCYCHCLCNCYCHCLCCTCLNKSTRAHYSLMKSHHSYIFDMVVSSLFFWHTFQQGSVLALLQQVSLVPASLLLEQLLHLCCLKLLLLHLV
jgi:hypothetical protein